MYSHLLGGTYPASPIRWCCSYAVCRYRRGVLLTLRCLCAVDRYCLCVLRTPFAVGTTGSLQSLHTSSASFVMNEGACATNLSKTAVPCNCVREVANSEWSCVGREASSVSAMDSVPAASDSGHVDSASTASIAAGCDSVFLSAQKKGADSDSNNIANNSYPLASPTIIAVTR